VRKALKGKENGADSAYVKKKKKYTNVGKRKCAATARRESFDNRKKENSVVKEKTAALETEREEGHNKGGTLGTNPEILEYKKSFTMGGKDGNRSGRRKIAERRKNCSGMGEHIAN